MTANLSRTLLTQIVGVTRALQQQSISLNEAEQIVFSPAILELAKKRSVDARITKLIQDGMELENVKSMMPDKYFLSICQIEKSAHELLKALPEYDYSGEKLLKELF